MNKKTLILIITIGAVILLLVVTALFGGTGRDERTIFPSPTIFEGDSSPTPFPNEIDPENLPAGSGVEFDKTEDEADKSEFVGELLTKLPYEGRNFSLHYSYARNVFTLYINPSFQNEGNLEFDTFLKTNGIDSRALLGDLETVSIKPTPGSE